MAMRKLNRYIGRTVAAAVFMVLLVIVGIDLLSALIDELKEIRGDYDFVGVLKYVGLIAPDQPSTNTCPSRPSSAAWRDWGRWPAPASWWSCVRQGSRLTAW